MFFSLSKIIWLFVQPLSVLLFLCTLIIVAFYCGWKILAVSLAVLACVIIILCGFTTLGAVLLNPLEERFQRPQNYPDKIAGIIVLGGYMSGEINAARGGTELNSAGDRIIETMRLAKIYPEAKIIVTGGEGTYFSQSKPDADSTKQLFEAFQIADDHVVYEAKSRNTVENALFTRDLVQPKGGEQWLLVTSAFHMPRSVGVFRKTGFDIIAWPVDYKTVPETKFRLYFQNANEAFARTSTALHEWLGLVIYWWKGKTEELFPKP
ncbi:YdcF family protein [Paenochrobactrum sp. BZR 588]|uniref:YdcF family protein n=1 Tax=Paenochrobactrum TaxID=999488 RepID=UPI0035BC5AE1